jgi:short chain dehydrogenase
VHTFLRLGGGGSFLDHLLLDRVNSTASYALISPDIASSLHEILLILLYWLIEYKMSGRINTILILGATRGIGEALARRFHSLGKHVIATGRGQDEGKLVQLSEELPGLEFRMVSAL